MRHWNTSNDYPIYAREVGSTDAALTGARNRNGPAGFPLDVDENGEVEFNLPDAWGISWIFGYVEEYVRRSRSKVTEI
jgi:hypothetical protein